MPGGDGSRSFSGKAEVVSPLILTTGWGRCFPSSLTGRNLRRNVGLAADLWCSLVSSYAGHICGSNLRRRCMWGFLLF